MSYGGSDVGTTTTLGGEEFGLSVFNNEKRIDETEKTYAYVPLHYVARAKKNNTYCYQDVCQIQVTYIIAAIIWSVMIFVLGFYKTTILGYIILAIPLIVFGINYANLSSVTKELESEMLKGNFLSFAFLVAIIIINWTKIEDKGKYFRIMFIALILLMLSLIDIWVSPDKMSLMRHIRTIFHTTSITLIVFALYLYYSEVVCPESNGLTDGTGKDACGMLGFRLN